MTSPCAGDSLTRESRSSSARSFFCSVSSELCAPSATLGAASSSGTASARQAGRPAGDSGKKRKDMEETLRLFRKYYVPAGVSMDWLKSIAPIIKKANLLQSGGDLISAKSGIIMYLAGELDRTGQPNGPARPLRPSAICQ